MPQRGWTGHSRLWQWWRRVVSGGSGISALAGGGRADAEGEQRQGGGDGENVTMMAHEENSLNRK